MGEVTSCVYIVELGCCTVEHRNLYIGDIFPRPADSATLKFDRPPARRRLSLLHPRSSFVSPSVVVAFLVVAMSGIARTANLLVRSSRASLARPTTVNPVLHVFGKDRLAARGLATAFERTKPHVNIGKQLPL